MSPLDDNDLDRIGDKVKLAIREAIDEALKDHNREEHRLIWAKLDGLNTKMLLASGGFAVGLWALANLLPLFK